MPHRMLAGLVCAATYVLHGAWDMGQARVAAPALCKEAPAVRAAKKNYPHLGGRKV
jgi:hypothetical protein